MDQWIRPVVFALLGFAFAMTPSETKGDEFYYAMIFGSQSNPKLLQYTHTWATFIRAVGEGTDANNYPSSSTPSVGCRNRLTSGPGACSPSPASTSTCTGLSKPSTAIANTSRCGGRSGSTVVYERSLGVKEILDSGAAEYRAISTPRNLLSATASML